jgi:two-component system chemotaxis response regulator CheB
MNRIRVFIVDDSAVVRKVLTDLLSQTPDIKVIGSAQDPLFAQAKMAVDWPDVIILDVEMPRMDGITYLRKIMSERPTPVVMCSTLTASGSGTSVQALRLGAIDVVAKPKSDLRNSLPEASPELLTAIRTAAKANMKAVNTRQTPSLRPANKLTADVMISLSGAKQVHSSDQRVIAIGASTGGTQALEIVLKALPATMPPILVVQHMPEKFTQTFAQRLNEVCLLNVKEAEDNDTVLPGRVLIAPGGQHMMLRSTQLGASVKVKDGPLVNRHKPSVDVLFRSVAKYGGSNAIGIIMTGMGDDGARGIKEMHNAGAITFAQNEATCVVYGMPQEAVKLGAIDKLLPLNKIADEIVGRK